MSKQNQAAGLAIVPKGATGTLRTHAARVARSVGAPYVGRAEVARGMMVAALAGEHVLLLGPPGTAKSAITRHFAAHFDGATHFDWLLTRFTQPEEIFGPISLDGMRSGRYERIPTGKLPCAHFAFLDEVFKANSSILNALLTAANERRWHDGATVHDIPLRTIIGASNEMPEDESLDAFFDRFLLRFNVDHVATTRDTFAAVLASTDARPVCTMTLEELTRAQAEVAAVDVSGIIDTLFQLSTFLRSKDVIVSDRRWKKCVKLVQASAWLDGYDVAESEDLMVLRSVLWSDPKDEVTVHEAVAKRALGPSEKALSAVEPLLARFEEIFLGGTPEHAKLSPWVRDAGRVIDELLKQRDATASKRSVAKINEGGRRVKEALKSAQAILFAAPDDEAGF